MVKGKLIYTDINGNETEVEIPEDGTPLIVGRLKSCDIYTKNPTVSRRHGKIYFENGSFFFEDMGSSNGSYYDGKRVRKHEFEDGDQIYCGNFEIKFRKEIIEEIPEIPEEEIEEIAEGNAFDEETSYVDSYEEEVQEDISKIEEQSQVNIRQFEVELDDFGISKDSVDVSEIKERIREEYERELSKKRMEILTLEEKLKEKDGVIVNLKKENDELINELHKLKFETDFSYEEKAKELETLRKENEEKEKVIYELRKELENLKEDVKRNKELEEEVFILQEKIKEYSDKITELNTEIQKKNEEFKKLHEEYSLKIGDEEKFELLNRENERLKEEVEKLENENESLKNRVASLEESVFNAKDDYGKTIKELSEILAIDASTIDDIKNEIKAVIQENDNLITQKMQLQDEVTSLNQKIAELQNSLESKQLDYLSLSREFDNFKIEKQREIEKLNKIIEEYPPEKFKELEEKFKTLKNDYNKLKGMIEDVSFILGLGYNIDIESIKKSIKDLMSTIEQNKEHEAKLQKEIETLKERLKKMENERNRLLAVKSEFDEFKENIEKEIEEKEKTISKLKVYAERFSQEKFSKLEQEMEKIKKENQELTIANRTYLKKVSNLIEEKNELEKEIEELKAKLFDDSKQKELEEIIATLNREKDDLVTRLSFYENNVGDFFEQFSEKFADWKTNLQIVKGISEDLEDELRDNPMVSETVATLIKYLDLIRDSSTELRKLFFEIKKKLN